MTGRVPEEGINPVSLPEAVEHVWWWFLQLNAKRPQGMSGICPIPESEIGWFFRNRGLTPELFEIEAITHLDEVAMTASTKENE